MVNFVLYGDSIYTMQASCELHSRENAAIRMNYCASLVLTVDLLSASWIVQLNSNDGRAVGPFLSASSPGIYPIQNSRDMVRDALPPLDCPVLPFWKKKTSLNG